MNFKNFKNIDKVLFGRGTIQALKDILEPKRTTKGFVLYTIDHYFLDKSLENQLDIQPNDIIRYIDVDPHEPTTAQIDSLRDDILSNYGLPDAVVGIGGGSILDIAKAVSLMFTNDGSSELYQGLNLIKKPGIYHLGIPTISGTGAEVSSTAVLTGPQKKLGLKCEWTVFNQVILDPNLIATVPTDKWFYTGMDTYIHCAESVTGILNNAFSLAYANQAMQLCRDIYIGEQAGQNETNDEKLMVASLMGGLSLSYSEVGVCHALSYGLSKILDYKHCYANCVVFQHLDDIYGEYVVEFQQMLKQHDIQLPQNISHAWSEETIHAMAEVAYHLPHMWHHAFGEDWQKAISIDFIKSLYKRL